MWFVLDFEVHGSKGFSVQHSFTKLRSFSRKPFSREATGMASIPMGTYSSSKIRNQLKSTEEDNQNPKSETGSKMFLKKSFDPENVFPNYNNKLMMSIWGQYNMNASHAFQKNIECAYSSFKLPPVPQVKNLWDFYRAAH